MGRHTLVLAQYAQSEATRKWSQHTTLSQAMESVIKVFEAHLKNKRPHEREISYSFEDLAKYIDELPDLVALVFDPQTSMYEPKNKDWIKNQILRILQKQAVE